LREELDQTDGDARPEPRHARHQELLERYPHASWRETESSSARFWLHVHDGFRYECAALVDLIDELHRGRLEPSALAARAAPRLRGTIVHLHGHHEIEDYHYFPAFRSHEPELAAALDVLEQDHQRLLLDMDLASQAAQDLLDAVASNAPDAVTAQRHAAATFARAVGQFCRHLERHLAEEEDLVIPLLLSRPDL
jgi:hypothetical protein